MPENPDDAQTPGFDPRDVVSAVKRRGKTVVIAAVVCVLTTVLLAMFLPARYRATGTILIEQQEVPQDLVRSTVSSYADQRIQVISQRVMTTQNLLEIINRHELYPRERRRESREKLMERMRTDIGMQMISADVIDPRSGLPRTATIAFTVSYTSRSPEKAVKVANELNSLYLNENLTERTRLAKDAAGFLREESDRLGAQVRELEAKLAQFKSENVDGLPELQSVNLQLLDRTGQELHQTQGRLMSLDQQRVFLEAQLVQLKPNSMLMSDSGERIFSSTDRLKMLRSKLASARAIYAPNHPDIVRMEREIRGLEAQTGGAVGEGGGNDLLRELEKAQAQLAQARERYAADHPDVQRLERSVAALQAALNGAPAAAASTPKSADNPDNPAYIQIQAQLAATNSDRAALTKQLARLQAQIGDYQRKIALAPQVERGYRELTREYESAQLKYREVHAKQMEAQLAQNLEADQKGERFALIEPPLPPEEPVSPNRPAILLIGLVLTLALCGALVALLEAIDATVRGRRDLQTAFHVPPLALVPRIVTAREMLARRRRRQIALGASAAACVVAVVAVHFFFRPLDVLWFVALRRFGL